MDTLPTDLRRIVVSYLRELVDTENNSRRMKHTHEEIQHICPWRRVVTVEGTDHHKVAWVRGRVGIGGIYLRSVLRMPPFGFHAFECGSGDIIRVMPL